MDRRHSLRQVLAGYEPLDPDERAHLDDLNSLLAATGDPFDRGRFDPGHVTASGFVRSANGRRLLLVHHAGLDRWLQPGGHVDPADPTVWAASAREVREETGLDVHTPDRPPVFDVDVHVIPASANGPQHRHFDVRFLWTAVDGEPHRSKESLDVVWVRIEELLLRLESASGARVSRKLSR